ncbi:MAG: SMP-30/gluconolactonase/LRE family protein [Paracoccaceae bacterium]|nr:SMP-30/gluconolactonase/LRE family protein [Paracoccaceae bacterium]
MSQRHRAHDPRFHDLVDINADVDQLGTGFTFTEGPIWHPVDQHLLFSDMPGDVRRRWTPDGRVSEAMRPSNKGNGMTYDRAHNLLVCEHATSSVARFTPDGRREVLCSRFEGKELNSPNDICVRSDGSVYFTDPTYGRMEHFGVPRPVQQGFQGVYRLPPGPPPRGAPPQGSGPENLTHPQRRGFRPCVRVNWGKFTVPHFGAFAHLRRPAPCPAVIPGGHPAAAGPRPGRRTAAGQRPLHVHPAERPLFQPL